MTVTIRIKHLKKSSGTKVYKSPRNYDSHKAINALIQEHITKALKNSKKDSKGSKESQKDCSESSSDSEDSDSGEDWGELLVLNPGEQGSSHGLTTTTALGNIKGNQETTKKLIYY